TSLLPLAAFLTFCTAPLSSRTHRINCLSLPAETSSFSDRNCSEVTPPRWPSFLNSWSRSPVAVFHREMVRSSPPVTHHLPDGLKPTQFTWPWCLPCSVSTGSVASVSRSHTRAWPSAEPDRHRLRSLPVASV